MRIHFNRSYCFCFLLIITLVLPSAGWTMTKEDDVVTFTNKVGTTFHARTHQTGDMKTTILKDSSEKMVLFLISTKEGIEIDSMQEGFSSFIPFLEPEIILPDDSALNQLALFIAGQIAKSKMIALDNPGCDLSPDTCCTLDCCYEHDKCYAVYGCDASSWRHTWKALRDQVETTDCDDCNIIVLNCISNSCNQKNSTPDEVSCFDAKCCNSYECESHPKKKARSKCDCDCTSPCDEGAENICDSLVASTSTSTTSSSQTTSTISTNSSSATTIAISSSTTTTAMDNDS